MPLYITSDCMTCIALNLHMHDCYTRKSESMVVQKFPSHHKSLHNEKTA